MSNTVLAQDEIVLYNTRFPIFGTVRRTAVTPFPPKITIGDYSRDDKIVTSSWVLNDFSGGSGILHAKFPTDADRYWYSTLETRYRHLSLTPRIHKAGALNGAADLITSYNERLYVVIGSNVHRWNETTKLWDDLFILNSKGVAIESFGGYLYILTGLGLHRYSDFDNTWGEFAGYGGYAMIEWDGKLFRLGLDNHMYWTNDSPTIWDELGILHLPSGYCRQLIIFFDQSGESVIHAITRVGVYGYEFASGKFFQTPMTFPVTQSAGEGAMVWRGELYVPAGQSVYKYNGATIQVVSPTRDDGLPPHLRGNVIQMVPGHAFFYSVISTAGVEEAATSDTPLFSTANWLEGSIMGAGQTTGAILASSQASWHGLYDELAGALMGKCYVGSVQESFRLWITSSNGIFYIDVPSGLHNPLQNPTSQYRRDGYLETGWTDLGWSDMDKLALSLDVRTEGCTDKQTITFYAAWDNNTEWQLVGTVNSDEQHQFHFRTEEGFVFRNMRLRIEMSRDPDNVLSTPVLRSAIVSFMRRPQYLWGWTINLNLTIAHAGKSSEELTRELYNLMENVKTAGRFAYRDDEQGILRNHRCVISNIDGSELAGMSTKGRYTISLLQLDEVEEDIDGTS